MKKMVRRIVESQTERVSSQMRELFKIIETYRKMHGIDPLTGKVKFHLSSFVHRRYNKIIKSGLSFQEKTR